MDILYILCKQEYVVERGICPIAAVCNFARYCSIVQTLSLKYPGRDFDLVLEVTRHHWSPDHTIRYVQFPIRALSELTQI